MLFHIPMTRVFKIIEGGSELLAAAARGEAVGARQLASFVGRVISCYIAAGPTTRLMTRAAFHQLKVATGVHDALSWRALKAAWGCSLVLGDETVDEIRFWLANIADLARRGAAINPEGPTHALEISSDASDWAWGAWARDGGTMLFAHERLEPGEHDLGSTYRELVGCERSL